MVLIGWAVLALFGLSVAAIAGIHLRADRSTPHAFGTPPAATPTSSATRAHAHLATTTTATAAPTPLSATARSPQTTQPATPRTGTAATTRPVSAPAAPVSLTLPSLGIAALVEHVGTTNGELGVPDNPAHVGWWIGGAQPGSPHGSVVIDGHVDSAATGPGALFAISQLHPHAQAVLATTTSHTLTYTVTAREIFSKAAGLPPRLFTTTGPPRLVLITCGGPFDTTTRSYQDNIVVYATPNPPRPTDH